MDGVERRQVRRSLAMIGAVAMGVAVGTAACVPPGVGRPAASDGIVRPSAVPRPAGDPAPTEMVPPGPTGRPSFVRPTPTPYPTFLAYVVQAGDTLTSIARDHRTTPRSIAFWNREAHPSLDPDSPDYAPNRIEAGWVLLLVPDLEADPEDFS